MGGWSPEREVSRASAVQVIKALDELGHAVTAIDVNKNVADLLARLDPRPDIVFNALHGQGGEDGRIQSILELLRIPFTHSGVAASAIAMNKSLTKTLLRAHGIQSPEGLVVERADLLSGHPLPPPYVVKPLSEGSSIGVQIVDAAMSVGRLTQAVSQARGPLLVERFIPGRELTVGVLGDRALCVTEIVSGAAHFSYDAKYAPNQAHHILPADIPPAVAETALEWALMAHRALGCSGISRSDFRYFDGGCNSESPDNLYFLEINTQPGLTPTSLLPEQALRFGISFPELISWILDHAVQPE